MDRDQGQFVGAGGLSLYYQIWHPPIQARAALVLIHGLGAHSDALKPVAQSLVPQGFVVYGMDLRGHGRSPGQRGYIHRWAEFRDDLRGLLQVVNTQTPNLPCFVMGHSLGAVIGLDYVLRSPKGIAGLILMAPALKQVGVSPIRMGLGQILSRMYPRFSLDTGIDLTASSRNPAVLVAEAQDPLRHTSGTARLATEFLATTEWIGEHAADLQVPLLILHGGADRVTSPAASQAFFEQITLADKERREYEGGYHDLYDDIIYLEVLADLADWLDRHLISAEDGEDATCVGAQSLLSMEYRGAGGNASNEKFSNSDNIV